MSGGRRPYRNDVVYYAKHAWGMCGAGPTGEAGGQRDQPYFYQTIKACQDQAYCCSMLHGLQSAMTVQIDEACISWLLRDSLATVNPIAITV